MNYALDTPTKRNIHVPDEVPFAPAYSPSIPQETDQTHRALTWQHDKRQQTIAEIDIHFPKSARLEKKK